MNFEAQTLRWYIAVAEELHFARAAKALNIARTKLSKAVNELETELGYPLFVPDESPTRLTDRGAEFLETARIAVAKDAERRREEAAQRHLAAHTLTVGYAEGVTPAKWVRIWNERFPDTELRLVPTTLDSQVRMLHDGSIDVGFVRLPIDRDELSVIGLYEEVPVVVVSKDHPIAAFDRIAVSDLADEHLLHEADEFPEWAALATEIEAGTRAPLPPIESNAELIEYVAAGLGVAVVPQSIARLHARKDLVYRPVDGLAGSPIAIAWPSAKTTDNVEQFHGIVRGRSVRSSRGTSPEANGAASRKSAGAGKSSGPSTKKKKHQSAPTKNQRKAPARGNRPKRG